MRHTQICCFMLYSLLRIQVMFIPPCLLSPVEKTTSFLSAHLSSSFYLHEFFPFPPRGIHRWDPFVALCMALCAMFLFVCRIIPKISILLLAFRLFINRKTGTFGVAQKVLVCTEAVSMKMNRTSDLSSSSSGSLALSSQIRLF